jgi:hypothetical protein
MLDHDLSVFDDDNKGITAGLLYRLDDAIIPVIQLQLGKFTIGTSYDINISKLTVASQSEADLKLLYHLKVCFNTGRVI